MRNFAEDDIESSSNELQIKHILIIFLVIFLYHKFIAFDATVLKNVELKPFADPVQERIENAQPFEHKVKDGVAKITPIANYKIYGRVYDHHYRPYKLYAASMYPYDISIGFGDFQYKDVYKRISVKMAGTVSYWNCSSSNWKHIKEKYFQQNSVSYYFTNNHLCPANKNVRKGISKLRKKDIVYIEGYLIKYELLRKNGNLEKGISSTARNDVETFSGNNGSGSCEQIFVTRVVSRHGDYK